MSENPLGDVIRELRQMQGMTQKQLAEEADVSEATIAKIEQTAEARPRANTLSAICSALGIKTFELYELQRVLEKQPKVNRKKLLSSLLPTLLGSPLGILNLIETSMLQERLLRKSDQPVRPESIKVDELRALLTRSELSETDRSDLQRIIDKLRSTSSE